jgi:hypothetical protein
MKALVLNQMAAILALTCVTQQALAGGGGASYPEDWYGSRFLIQEKLNADALEGTVTAKATLTLGPQLGYNTADIQVSYTSSGPHDPTIARIESVTGARLPVDEKGASVFSATGHAFTVTQDPASVGPWLAEQQAAFEGSNLNRLVVRRNRVVRCFNNWSNQDSTAFINENATVIFVAGDNKFAGRDIPVSSDKLSFQGKCAVNADRLKQILNQPN